MVTAGHGKRQMDTVLDTVGVTLSPEATMALIAFVGSVRNAALEEAAKVCDDVVEDMSHCGTDGARGALYASRGIRALKRE